MNNIYENMSFKKLLFYFQQADLEARGVLEAQVVQQLHDQVCLPNPPNQQNAQDAQVDQGVQEDPEDQEDQEVLADLEDLEDPVDLGVQEDQQPPDLGCQLNQPNQQNARVN